MLPDYSADVCGTVAEIAFTCNDNYIGDYNINIEENVVEQTGKLKKYFL